MKKKYLIAMGFAAIVFMAGVTACGKNDGNRTTEITEQITTERETTEEVTTEQANNEDAGTVADVLVEQFRAEAESTADVTKMADALSKNAMFKEVAMTTMEIEPGYLSGFENEIQGFSKGTMFAPMIGTIPFVGYVFETENTDELVKTLEENAKLDWNICTTADEMKIDVVGNYVVFVMSPKAFE